MDFNDRLNHQPTRELVLFQKTQVQQQHIKQLNAWLDERDWELEKAHTVIQMKDGEIVTLRNEVSKLNQIIVAKQKRIEKQGTRICELNNVYQVSKNDRLKALRQAAINIKQNKGVQKIREALGEAVAISELLYQQLDKHGIRPNIKL
jgi:hypothetical protein